MEATGNTQFLPQCMEHAKTVGLFGVKLGDCVNKIAELVSAIMDLIAYCASHLADALKSPVWNSAFTVVRMVADYTAFVNLVKRIMEWSDPKNWDTLPKLATLSTMSVANLFSGLNLFIRTSVIPIVGPAATVIAKSEPVLYIAALICDIWLTVTQIDQIKEKQDVQATRKNWWVEAKAIIEAEDKRQSSETMSKVFQIKTEINRKIENRVTSWTETLKKIYTEERLSRGDTQQTIVIEIGRGALKTYITELKVAIQEETKENPLRLDKDKRQAIEKFIEWQKIQGLMTQAPSTQTANSNDTIKQICDFKISRLDTRVGNQDRKMTQGWIYIATDVCFIAMFVFTLTMPTLFASVGGPYLPLVIAGLAAAFTDKTGFWTAICCLRPKKIQSWDDFVIQQHQPELALP